MTKIISVSLMSNGDIVTSAMRKHVDVKLIVTEDGKTDYEMKVISEFPVTFRSKAIVMSHGGMQLISPKFYDWFPKLKGCKDRVLTSDEFLKEEVFMATIKRIKAEKLKKIVIIGGSHSGFSAAWMLLNGPADLWHNTHRVPTCVKNKKPEDP